MKACYQCGAEWMGEGKVGFHDTCPKCHAALHCCRNCRLYDEFAHNKCRSRTTEMVADREKANFCDEFDFADVGKAQAGAKPTGGRTKWDSLWR
jgi:hypothetical protein